MLLINFKAYSTASGSKALRLAKAADKISEKLDVRIGVVPSFLDIEKISMSAGRIPVFSQGVSTHEPGSHTGSITAHALKRKGVYGVVLNHAENRIDEKELKKTLELCKKYKLKTLVCAEDIKQAKEFSKLRPDYVAIEPPELIGGKVSVSTAKPGIIEKGVKAVKKGSKSTKVLVGAGIKSKKDVKKALELGADGVFVASAICKARKKGRAIQELAEGFK